MLTYGFVEVTNTAVDVASITSFWFVVGAAHLIASLTIAIVVIAITFRKVSLRHALVSARAAARRAAEAQRRIRSATRRGTDELPVANRTARRGGVS
jgi:hypothetical protein